MSGFLVLYHKLSGAHVLTESQRNIVVYTACHFLGRAYCKQNFDCLSFVKMVYDQALGVNVVISSNSFIHLGTSDLLLHVENHCFRGCVLELRHKKSTKRVSHFAILDSNSVVHCSYYFGKKVVITDLSELLKVYDLADPSPLV